LALPLGEDFEKVGADAYMRARQDGRRRSHGARRVAPARPDEAAHGSPAAHDPSDFDLARALASWDEDALAELYDRYGALAHKTALRMLGNSASAEDVVQDAFLKLWKNAANFSPERGSLRLWLVTAVRRRAIDRLRGHAGHEREEVDLKPDLSCTESDPSRRITGSEQRMAIRQALDSLPIEQRLAVELMYFGSYTQTEIAAMMGVTLGTVKGRMRLGLHKLGARIQDRTLLEG
jgi:RNA polymerase sigma-70 factor (ECF subfamily)